MKPNVDKIMDNMVTHYKRSCRCNYIDENTFEDDRFLFMLEEYVKDALEDGIPPSEIIDDDFVSDAKRACQYGGASDPDDFWKILDDMYRLEKAV